MGLITNTHKEYYQGQDLGNYQFISVNDIVSQFMISYVGENKIIPKIKPVDVSFHAMRALQELSFDTFKSIKAQQITVPSTLTMPLPHDYVNYTKISTVDSSGIKHPLYHTKHTSNPYQILQDENNEYSFPVGTELVNNADFSQDFSTHWNRISGAAHMASLYQGNVGVISGKLTWRFVTKNGYGAVNWSQVPVAYQAVDVSENDFVDLSADGVAESITYNVDGGGTDTASGTIRLGLLSYDPSTLGNNINDHPTITFPPNHTYVPNVTYAQTPFVDPNIFDITYLEWTVGESSTKEILGVNVSQYNTVYIVALSMADFPSGQVYGEAVNGNTLDNISIKNTFASNMLQQDRTNGIENSSTWNSYKSTTPSENNNENYEDDVYWPIEGERYGLEPSHAQVNGSFYIDQRLGKIHFSSNVSGKTIILDYISDSLGTDKEMQVHKFAEEAMYKCIAYAILSASSYGQQLVPRFKKEKFAAVRQAKLRLSSIKLEELTQILRGKSKQIKH